MASVRPERTWDRVTEVGVREPRLEALIQDPQGLTGSLPETSRCPVLVRVLLL